MWSQIPDDKADASGVLAPLLYLHTWLRQVDLESHLLPHEDVWVAGLGEERLQDVQLCSGEGGALPALLPRSGCTSRTQRQCVIKVDKQFKKSCGAGDTEPVFNFSV